MPFPLFLLPQKFSLANNVRRFGCPHTLASSGHPSAPKPSEWLKKGMANKGERGDSLEVQEQLPQTLNTYKEATAENAESDLQCVRKSVRFLRLLRFVSACNGCCWSRLACDLFLHQIQRSGERGAVRIRKGRKQLFCKQGILNIQYLHNHLIIQRKL